MYSDGKQIERSIQTVQTNIQKVEDELTKKELEFKNIKLFEQEVLIQEQNVKYFLNFIPSSLTFTDVTTLLINEARSAGVNIFLKKDEKVDKKKESEYRVLNVKLTISGSFSQILLFLSKLTSQRRMLIVKNIDMTMKDTSQLIEANLTISAYRYEKNVEKTEKDENT